MRHTYKTPLTLSEQVEYLSKNKRVVYNNISKSDAECILLYHNYINVISPFKYKFAKIDSKTKEPVRDSNKQHIYEHDTEFSEYYKEYNAERDKYSTIYSNLMNFETTFNSVLSYEVIHYYHLSNYSAFQTFVENLKSNLMNANLMPNQKQKILDEFNGFINEISRYEDIYSWIGFHFHHSSISLCTVIAQCELWCLMNF